jgi:transposase
MALQPQEIPPVPQETRRVAQVAFPRGNVYMRMRDEPGAFYDDHQAHPWRSEPRGNGRKPPSPKPSMHGG